MPFGAIRSLHLHYFLHDPGEMDLQLLKIERAPGDRVCLCESVVLMEKFENHLAYRHHQKLCR